MINNIEPKFIFPKLLLHPNIPKPLHGVNPRSVLGKDWWDKHRQIAYAKNNYCCWACGIHKSKAKYHQWLEAHEAYNINYQKGTLHLEEIIALCYSCHNFIHSGRMNMLVIKGEMTKETMLSILMHGKTILHFNGETHTPQYIIDSLESRKAITTINHVEWENWRLIIDNKKYPPIHKSFEAWKEFYGDK